MDDFIDTCRVCGCTDMDCSQCIDAQGFPCSWKEQGLCCRCAKEIKTVDIFATILLPVNRFKINVSFTTEIKVAYAESEMKILCRKIVKWMGIRKAVIDEVTFKIREDEKVA